MGVPRNLIHSEIFATKSGPAYAVESSGGVGGRITLADTGDTIEAQPQETLLAALERSGYHPEFSCRVGSCGTCKLRVLAGQVNPVGEALSEADRAEGYVLSCIAHPIGDVTLQSGGGSGGAAVGAGHAGHAGARALVRLGAFVGVSALLFASWNMTNHRPTSWAAAAPVVASPTVGPTATPTTSAHPTATTATVKSGSGGSAPAPAPTATPKPKPKPAATATPSPAH